MDMRAQFKLFEEIFIKYHFFNNILFMERLLYRDIFSNKSYFFFVWIWCKCVCWMVLFFCILLLLFFSYTLFFCSENCKIYWSNRRFNLLEIVMTRIQATFFFVFDNDKVHENRAMTYHYLIQYIFFYISPYQTHI